MEYVLRISEKELFYLHSLLLCDYYDHVIDEDSASYDDSIISLYHRVCALCASNLW